MRGSRRQLVLHKQHHAPSFFSFRKCISAFILIVFLVMFSLLFMMINRTETNQTSPEQSSSNLNEIKQSIAHKDISELLAATTNGDQKISDQNMAEILNRNFAVEEEEETEEKMPVEGIESSGDTKSKKKVVAYAITVTKDGPFVDGALVLGYAAQKVHDTNKGYKSPYNAELVAFVTPNVITSRPILEKFGWKILEKELPVALDEIENQKYANKMKDSGCCGADEFLKLWAYTLTQYHRVVHLDMDSIIYKSMDSLYSIDKEMLFTGDYNMGTKPVPPAQGGFLVIRPSVKRFQEYQDIIRKGDWGNKGWGGSGIGGSKK